MKRPNILVIVADDLGFSDIGAFGGEIETPNLDALAREGRLLTNFHVAPACSPTRAMLFSGTDHHLVGLGQLAEALPQYPGWQGKPGYEGYLNERALSAAEILRDNGYFTCMAGKWHLGLKPEHSPKAKGFERSLGMLAGASHYFAQIHTFATPEGKLVKAQYREDGELIDLPEAFYATELYTDRLIGYLEQQRDAGDTRPFFAYAAYTAPHWPLQAPDRYIAKYRGKYSEGHASVRARRIEKMKALGIIAPDFEVFPGLPASPAQPLWEQLSVEEKEREARRMEIYAGMVDCLDENIGRLLDYLRKSGIYNDTFIYFMSDNGPDGLTEKTGPIAKTSAFFDNRLENMGRKGSFVCAGPRWAEVSATPFRAVKGTTAEGGITAAAITRLPGGINGGQGAPLAALTHVTDLLPCFLELAGIENPGIDYRGRAVHPMTGQSMLAYLQGTADAVHEKGYVLGEELLGRRAVMRDGWKLLWIEPPRGIGEWQLYDLNANRGETQDQMKAQPELARQLEREWEGYVERNGVILCPYPLAGGVA